MIFDGLLVILPPRRNNSGVVSVFRESCFISVLYESSSTLDRICRGDRSTINHAILTRGRDISVIPHIDSVSFVPLVPVKVERDICVPLCRIPGPGPGARIGTTATQARTRTSHVSRTTTQLQISRVPQYMHLAVVALMPPIFRIRPQIELRLPIKHIPIRLGNRSRGSTDHIRQVPRHILSSGGGGWFPDAAGGCDGDLGVGDGCSGGDYPLEVAAIVVERGAVESIFGRGLFYCYLVEGEDCLHAGAPHRIIKQIFPEEGERCVGVGATPYSIPGLEEVVWVTLDTHSVADICGWSGIGNADLHCAAWIDYSDDEIIRGI